MIKTCQHKTTPLQVHLLSSVGFVKWPPLTCEDLPGLLLIVVVLDQVTGEAVRPGGQPPRQQQHLLVGADSATAEEEGRVDKWNAFIQCFSNQWPLKTLYNIAQDSPVHTHIHTPTAESTMQGDSQLVRSSQGEVSRSGTPRHSARKSRGSN